MLIDNESVAPMRSNGGGNYDHWSPSRLTLTLTYTQVPEADKRRR